MGLNRAVALIADKEVRTSRAREPKRTLRKLGSHPADGAPVWLKSGRHGPFVAHRRRYALGARGRRRRRAYSGAGGGAAGALRRAGTTPAAAGRPGPPDCARDGAIDYDPDNDRMASNHAPAPQSTMAGSTRRPSDNRKTVPSTIVKTPEGSASRRQPDEGHRRHRRAPAAPRIEPHGALEPVCPRPSGRAARGKAVPCRPFGRRPGVLRAALPPLLHAPPCRAAAVGGAGLRCGCRSPEPRERDRARNARRGPLEPASWRRSRESPAKSRPGCTGSRATRCSWARA